MEEKIKNAYDGLMYLIYNYKTPMTASFLNRFFYLILGEQLDSSEVLIIVTKYFHLSDLSPIEKAIEFHLYVYKELFELEEEKRLMISLFFLNFTLIKNGLPNIQLFCKEIKEYCKLRDAFFKEDKAPMLVFMLSVIKSQDYQVQGFKCNIFWNNVKQVNSFLETF